MALKDLPKTFFVDFTILLSQSSIYQLNKAIESAGPKPSSSYVFAYNRGALAVTLMFNYFNTYIKPLSAALKSGQGTQTFINQNTGTFSKDYIDTTTWANNFFTLRTQLLGAIGGNSKDPIITKLDAVWEEFSLISGRWVIIVPSDKKKFK